MIDFTDSDIFAFSYFQIIYYLCVIYSDLVSSLTTIFVAGFVIAVSGLLIYYYWDNITSAFHWPLGIYNNKGKRPQTLNRQTGEFEDYVSDASTPARNYPDGYLHYFSRKMGDLSNQVNSRAKELYNNSTNSIRSYFSMDTQRSNHIPTIATRDFYVDKNNISYWKGLPLSRTEFLENGDEYYMFLDKNNIVNILDNKIATNSLDLVNPLTGLSIGRRPLDSFEMSNIRANKTIKAYFEAPAGSYLRNPQISNIADISTPQLENTSILDSPPNEFRKPAVPMHIPTIAPEKKAFSQLDFHESDLGDVTITPIPRVQIRPISPDATPRASTSQLPASPDATPSSTVRWLQKNRNLEKTKDFSRDPFSDDWSPYD